jgi:hypothetical protein
LKQTRKKMTKLEVTRKLPYQNFASGKLSD